MNFQIETLNQWGGGFMDFAWPMLWQSSLLIALIFALDLVLARKIRAAVRYGLWLVVLLKLILPPTLAVPTSAGWWLFRKPPIVTPVAKFTVTYGDPAPLAQFILHRFPPAVKPELDVAAYALLASLSISAALFVWLLVRWQQMRRKIRHAAVTAKFADALESALRTSGLRSRVTVKIVDGYLSPAVCGLLKPVILLPRILVEKLSAGQLRAVMLHELFHHRRKDVWVNCVQTFLQIFYWWHPLLWLANARIRRVREEAVDDAVMLSLRDEPDLYAPTLLEVAKLAFYRPRLSVGLVGIMESRSALGQRIERLVNFRAPRRAGLTIVSVLGITLFIAVTVPMGGAPAPETDSALSGSPSDDSVRVFAIERPVEKNSLAKILIGAGVNSPPTDFFYETNRMLIVRGSAQQLDLVERVVRKLNGYLLGPVKKMAPLGAKSVEFKKNVETNLFERAFSINRYFFPTDLRNISSINSEDVAMLASNLFSQLGVNWNFPKGKSIAYSDQNSLLFVKATKQDLDMLEQVVGALETAETEVHIKARFFEGPVGSISLGTNDPDNFSWVMDDAYFRTILKKLESTQGVKELAEPDVVTTSARQTQMRATFEETVLTNYAYETSKPYVRPQLTSMQFGPVFDAIPVVSADRRGIHLHATATLTDFLGYEQTTNTVVVHTKAGYDVTMPGVVYDVCVRKASRELDLSDNQTVALKLNKHFFSNGTEINSEPDAKKAALEDKVVLVFITATLVDPAGNRIHPNDESYYKYPTPDPILIPGSYDGGGSGVP